LYTLADILSLDWFAKHRLLLPLLLFLHRFEKSHLGLMTMWNNHLSIISLCIAVILYMSLTSSKIRLDEYYSSIKWTFDLPSREMSASFSTASGFGSRKPGPPTSCSYNPKVSKCPLRPYYNNACSNEAEEKYRDKLKSLGWQGLSRQRLEDAVGNKRDELLVKLRSIFHQRRVVLVGDSLMQQWYETLSCRLGMSAKWFELGNTEPSERLEDILNTSGIFISPLTRLPEGMSRCAGYSIASTEVNDTDNTTDYCGFETKFEYVKYARMSPKHKILNFWNTLMMPEYRDGSTYGRETLLIFNIGLHYTKYPRDLYTSDLSKALKACGDMNKVRKGRVRCLFRDFFPQHHLIKPPATRFPKDWMFNEKDLEKGCGPFDEFQNLVVFPNYTDWYRLAESHGVPVIKILDNPIWIDAWNYHFDCTHYCQDSILWDVLHWTFVNLLENEDSSAFLPDSEHPGGRINQVSPS
jgi:hypothetical protein